MRILADTPFSATISGYLITVMSALTVSMVLWLARTIFKLNSAVEELTKDVVDVKRNGSERLEEILGQSHRTERIAILAAIIGVVGWSMRGFINPMRNVGRLYVDN